MGPNISETERLLRAEHDAIDAAPKETPAGYYAMPISFLASCAMAATAASTVYGYAHIVCKDASQCEDAEKAAYASAVAAATTIANVCGLMAVSVYERLATQKGLGVWIGLRAGSVVVLGAGGKAEDLEIHLATNHAGLQKADKWSTVLRRSVSLALGARVLEGLATDNTLHMMLNALYARSKDQRHVGRLMSTSLALYMAGMALSPALAALLADFRVSFAAALVVFGIAAVYLAAIGTRLDDECGDSLVDNCHRESDSNDITAPSLSGLASLARPALRLFSHRVLAAHGGAMFLYNAAISYMFPALMVHATLRFGFTPAQNGLLLSVAAGTSSLHLILAAVMSKHSRNAAAVLISLTVLVAALAALATVQVPWVLFPVVAAASLGLATPSFVKAHLVQRRPHDGLAVAALSVAEGLGSLVSAPLLGAWQSTHPGGSVLYVAATLATASATVFIFGCT